MRVADCEKGRTLIEILAVISIAGVIIAGAVKFFDRAFARYRLTRVAQQVVELQRAVDKRFIAKKTYDGLTLQLLQDEGLMPSDIRFKDNKFYHRLGGEIELTLSGDKTNYVIKFKSMPKYACMELSTQNWGLDPRVMLNGMTVRNQNLKWRCTSNDTNCSTMPLSVTDANTICGTSTVDMSWNFY